MISIGRPRSGGGLVSSFSVSWASATRASSACGSAGGVGGGGVTAGTTPTGVTITWADGGGTTCVGVSFTASTPWAGRSGLDAGLVVALGGLVAQRRHGVGQVPAAGVAGHAQRAD